MAQAIRETSRRHAQGLPCWCEGVSGHAGWLVCAEFRAGVIAAKAMEPSSTPASPVEPLARGRSDRAGCDSNEADSARRSPSVDALAAAMHVAYETEAVRAGWETQERSRVPYATLPEANKQAMRAGVLAMLDLLHRDGWRKTTPASDQTHAHPTEPGMVLGTLCTVCATSLDDGGCPLCVTCCEREP